MSGRVISQITDMKANELNTQQVPIGAGTTVKTITLSDSDLEDRHEISVIIGIATGNMDAGTTVVINTTTVNGQTFSSTQTLGAVTAGNNTIVRFRGDEIELADSIVSVVVTFVQGAQLYDASIESIIKSNLDSNEITVIAGSEVDIIKLGGNTISTNAGAADAGTLRVVTSSDSEIDVSEMGGVAVSMGAGATDAGSQRVAIPTDATIEINNPEDFEFQPIQVDPDCIYTSGIDFTATVSDGTKDIVITGNNFVLLAENIKSIELIRSNVYSIVDISERSITGSTITVTSAAANFATGDIVIVKFEKDKKGFDKIVDAYRYLNLNPVTDTLIPFSASGLGDGTYTHSFDSSLYHAFSVQFVDTAGATGSNQLDIKTSIIKSATASTATYETATTALFTAPITSASSFKQWFASDLVIPFTQFLVTRTGDGGSNDGVYAIYFVGRKRG